ncbi:MAG: hypothetical protein ACRDJ3_02620, partial [Solirubrobacteraceae bacterium]
MVRMAKSTRAAKTALLLACVLAALACAEAPSVTAGVRRTTTPNAPGYSVTLEQCVTSTVQSERSATFTAQMVATPATQKMALRFELQERMRGETDFHTVVAPGLGVWQRSDVGVKIYKYVKQVTNLAAPAAYRAVVRFRWVGEKGRALKRAELH